jgi:hypothetical protein
MARQRSGSRRLGGRHRRSIDEAIDPLDSLANLFELAMVLAVALLTMIAVRFNMADMFSNRDFTMVKNPGKGDMEIIEKKGSEIVRYKASSTTGEGSSGGKRVGVAYQLPSGEVIYVPDK